MRGSERAGDGGGVATLCPARRAERLSAAYNATTAENPERRAALLAELLCAVGPGSEVRPPFHCDDGTKRLLSVFLVALALVALIAVSATSTVEAKPADSSDSEKSGEPFISPIQDGVVLFPVTGNHAECIADCGNGTGFHCTGESVSCTDGVGCTAEGGGVKITGECNPS